MKESLKQFRIHLRFVLADDIFSGDLELIDKLIVANGPHPFFERLSKDLLIDLQFLGMVDLSLGFHAQHFLVLFFQQQRQLLRVVSFLRPRSLKLLVVLALAVPAEIQRVVEAHGGPSGCEVVVNGLMGAALAGPTVRFELIAMDGLDVVGTLQREDIVLLQQTPKKPLSDDRMKDLIDLLLLLHVFGLLHLALRQPLVLFIVIHGDSLSAR